MSHYSKLVDDRDRELVLMQMREDGVDNDK